MTWKSWNASGLALRFGFGEHRLDRIISVTAPLNTAARRVMERIGLEEQGTRRWKGVEVVWYALDRTDWQARGKQEGPPLLGA